MAYHLCSSLSSLYRDRQPLCNSPSSSRSFRIRHFSKPFFKPIFLAPQSGTALKITQVSLQDPIPKQSENPNSSNVPNSQYPNGKTKSYIWVNPTSPRASKLRQHSYDARYASLKKVAESLNSCNPNVDEVSRILGNLGDNILEQDAVIVLNNTLNQETAPIALKLFQKTFKPRREVILYNVTLKVFRKCKDMVVSTIGHSEQDPIQFLVKTCRFEHDPFRVVSTQN